MMLRIVALVLLGVVLARAGTTQILEENQQYAQLGSQFELSCRQSDCRVVKWSKDDKDISAESGKNYDITSKQVVVAGECEIISTLTKTNVVKEDGGNYKCRSENGVEDVRNVAVVTITANDYVLVDDAEKATLACSVDGMTGNGVWIWYHNGTEIVPDDEKYFVFDSNITLVIKKPSHKDIGVYECTFKKDRVNLSQIVNLFSKPYIENFEHSKNLVQGDPLVLKAKVWAHPAPTVSWLKNNLPLDLSDPRISLNSSMGVANASLRIDNLDFEDRAEYTILAINEYGSGNATVMVRVKDKLAALWPFLGIVCEVVILCIIIFIYERRRAKKLEEEENIPEEQGHLTNSNDHKGKDEIRQRK